MHPALAAVFMVVAECLAQPGADFARLAREMEAKWPTSGVVTARYQDDVGNVHAVAFEFAHSWWYRDDRSGVAGVDADGAYWGAPPRPLSRVPDVQTGYDFRLDPYFPQMLVRGVASRPDRVKSLTAREGGGWTVELSLPRGSREFTLAELQALSPVEVERRGGPEKIFTTVTLVLDSSLRVRSVNNGEEPEMVYTDAEGYPPGFQVVSECGGWLKGMKLASCTFDPSGRSGLAMGDVEARIRDSRAHGAKQTPVTPVVKGNVIPIGGPPRASRSTPWLVGGVVVLLLGVALWLRRRTAA
ncbi:MAG: hypothetical protein IT437_00250 [Phycisphaerales bacterium]|nr:hypothetical protein [Phycisphaerales bacterium]